MSGQRRTITTDSTSGAPSAGDPLPPRRYGRLLRKVVATTTAVVFLPVVALALADYGLFRAAIHVEALRPIARLTTISKLAVESFLHERRSAPRLIARGALTEQACTDAGHADALGGVLLTARKLVRSFRESDDARVRFFQRMEFTNKLATVGRLAAGVAHEINNPLAIIDQKAGLLHDRLSLGPDFTGKDRALKSTPALVRSVERCSVITHRLLGFAKHMEIQYQDIDLEKLLREVLGFLEKQARHRQVSVSWQVEGVLPRVRSDRGQLQQVFLNLLNNAIAAVDDGGQIEIAIRREAGSELAVEIADDGVGIPEAHMKRIFEPFFTTKPGAGTGLGLAVSYGIIQKLGGVIRVESSPGAGTRFTIVLPTRAP